MVLRLGVLLVVMWAMFAEPAAHAQRERQPPYWASISAGRAMMRTGPGRTYPATWLYVRRDLPVRVIETYPSWRKVQDPDGTTGWMLVNLLSDARTAIVTGDVPRPLHEAPDEGSQVRFRAEPGVIGRVSRCADGWCQLDVRGQRGFVRTEYLWGVDSDETIR
jgi:SH3-like domain-containing protein